MKPPSLRLALSVALAVLPAAQLTANEGMWVPQQLSEIAPALLEAGLALDPEDLTDLTGAPLGAVVSLGGCTASFVSANGLAATNHHCAYGAIQLNSTPERNLMREGFYADTLADEISAGPATRMYVLDSIADVTADIRPALDAEEDPLARSQRLDQLEKALIARCENTPGIRCRLYSFMGGNQYRLFRNLEIRDVRLVYAPPGGVGAFGGDIDNWMWPRQTGDFAFYRAYVGPDGVPADYAEDNLPYRPAQWLDIADTPLATGDFVMAAGYPGRTNRYALASEFEQTEQWTYPTIIQHYRALIDMVKARGEDDEEIDIRYASMVRGWENTMKNYAGQLEGFARTDAAAHKRAEEAAVLAWLHEQGEAGQAALQAHARLVDVNAADHARSARELALVQFDNTSLIATAIRLYRLAIEREKPDPERAQGFQERDRPAIEAALKQMERRYVPAMDRELQRYSCPRPSACPRLTAGLAALIRPASNASWTIWQAALWRCPKRACAGWMPPARNLNPATTRRSVTLSRCCPRSLNASSKTSKASAKNCAICRCTCKPWPITARHRGRRCIPMPMAHFASPSARCAAIPDWTANRSARSPPSTRSR